MFSCRRLIGRQTKFQSLEWYRNLASGKITIEEWSKLPAKDLANIRTPIYEDEIKG